MREFTFAIELCEDLWVPQPPSGEHAMAGAHLIVNLSASDELTGKASYRRDLVKTSRPEPLAAICMRMPEKGNLRRIWSLADTI